MFQENESYIFAEPCNGLLVPSAEPVTITPGTEVQVTQFKGGSATVLFQGNLVRIERKTLEQLGLVEKTLEIDQNKKAEGPVDMDDVWAQMRTCYDPEIPVNVVELGLIYDCKVTPGDDSNRVDIKMTLTAPGCAMGPVLINDIKQKVYEVENVTDVEVELVFDPPWTQDMLSDEAKLQLGLF